MTIDGFQWLLIFQENLGKTALELAGCKHSGCRGRWFKSSRPIHVQESAKGYVWPSVPYPAFCLEAAQVPPFLKHTLTLAIEIPLKLKGTQRKRKKINDTRENEPKRDLTPLIPFDDPFDISSPKGYKVKFII